MIKKFIIISILTLADQNISITLVSAYAGITHNKICVSTKQTQRIPQITIFCESS